MKSNERLIEALKKKIEINPDIELGKYIRYISSASDLAYMTDEDICKQIKNDYYEYSEINPNKYNYFDSDIWGLENRDDKLYIFSKEMSRV